MNKKIGIAYIATEGYTNYFTNFIRTLEYIFPDDFKYVFVFSNLLEEYNGYKSGMIKDTKVYKIYPFVYPTVNIHKNLLINEEMLDKDLDYIAFFDADTIFEKVEGYDWESIYRILDDNNFIISYHPVYILNDDETFCGWSKESWINNFYSSNVTEKNENRVSYIPNDEYKYKISSFFMAKPDIMKSVGNEITDMTRRDLTRYPDYHLPHFIDENYYNRLTLDYEEGKDNRFKFYSDFYISIYGLNSYNTEKVFIKQKNMTDFKNNRR